jgi:hypothetical protein
MQLILHLTNSLFFKVSIQRFWKSLSQLKSFKFSIVKFWFGFFILQRRSVILTEFHFLSQWRDEKMNFFIIYKEKHLWSFSQEIHFRKDFYLSFSSLSWKTIWINNILNSILRMTKLHFIVNIWIFKTNHQFTQSNKLALLFMQGEE